jgi:putative AdoMet-dependent methyltransferase
VAVSVTVMHHLPDLWKAVALDNVHCVLKPSGQFLLCDVVFSSRQRHLRWQFDAFINSMPQAMCEGAKGHIANEFSTLDWIMEGLSTPALP